jgi:hypothetical protein
MARLEIPEETSARLAQVGRADLLIGVPAAVPSDELRERTARAMERLSTLSARTVIAYPGANALEAAEDDQGVMQGDPVQFFHYAPAQAGTGGLPWLEMSGAYRTLFALAESLEVRTCIVVAPDLLAMEGNTLHTMLDAVVEKQADLAMAVYPFSKFDGLLNTSILAPLSRALYGRRVRYPLAADFAASSKLFARFSESVGGQSVMWPASEAALAEAQIGQVHVNVNHAAQTGGQDLSSVLSELVGSLFLQMEDTAASWQRIRNSQPLPVYGSAAASAPDGHSVDVQPMLDSFHLGSRNLGEVWSLVLPPVTLLELKRLTRLGADQFRMPDELWARIIYDFALAHRLRTINRNHLLGALTPLYLGWVASYALEVGKATPAAAEMRVEKLARAFEEVKSYLVSRWRWPDRFNP